MRVALISDIHGNRWALDAASYAVVEDTEQGWEVSFHRIAYDWEAAAACAERNRRPEWAYALRTGFALRASP